MSYVYIGQEQVGQHFCSLLVGVDVKESMIKGQLETNSVSLHSLCLNFSQGLTVHGVCLSVLYPFQSLL